MNYLILSPYNVGSTFLTSMLSVYLNAANYNFYTNKAIIRRVGLLDNNAIINDHSLDFYSQSLTEITKLLTKNTQPLITRITTTHVNERMYTCKDSVEDFFKFYKFLNGYFDKIIFLNRSPFEFALSRVLRDERNLYCEHGNVYTLDEKRELLEKTKFQIGDNTFTNALDVYFDYTQWVFDNFQNVITVDYDDLMSDIDLTLANLTGVKFNFEEKFGIDINNYNKLMYKLSCNTAEYHNFKKSAWKSVLNIRIYQDTLRKEQKIDVLIPIKIGTIDDKKNHISNFDHLVEVYNKYVAKKSNTYLQVDDNYLMQKQKKDHNNFCNVDLRYKTVDFE